MNSLIIPGYPEEDAMLIKQAGDRVTNARKTFGNICGGDKQKRRNHGKDYGITH